MKALPLNISTAGAEFAADVGRRVHRAGRRSPRAKRNRRARERAKRASGGEYRVKALLLNASTTGAKFAADVGRRERSVTDARASERSERASRDTLYSGRRSGCYLDPDLFPSSIRRAAIALQDFGRIYPGWFGLMSCQPQFCIFITAIFFRFRCYFLRFRLAFSPKRYPLRGF